jgi:Asp-tRNA(Asn)/Glu-tRNA(Gln) amidotransferase A subunit family amidase
VPAAFCGLYGLKATFGRISNKGCADLALTVGSYGPIAATVDDLALAYSVIAGPDTEDKHTLLQPPLSFKDYYNYQDLSDLTIATIPDWEVHVKDRVILDKMSQLKVKLTKLGAHFVELDYPMFDSVHIGKAFLCNFFFFFHTTRLQLTIYYKIYFSK